VALNLWNCLGEAFFSRFHSKNSACFMSSSFTSCLVWRKKTSDEQMLVVHVKTSFPVSSAHETVLQHERQTACDGANRGSLESVYTAVCAASHRSGCFQFAPFKQTGNTCFKWLCNFPLSCIHKCNVMQWMHLNFDKMLSVASSVKFFQLERKRCKYLK